MVGDGGICGSTMLNMRFKEFLVRKLGQDVSKDDMNEVNRHLYPIPFSLSSLTRGTSIDVVDVRERCMNH